MLLIPSIVHFCSIVGFNAVVAKEVIIWITNALALGPQWLLIPPIGNFYCVADSVAVVVVIVVLYFVVVAKEAII